MNFIMFIKEHFPSYDKQRMINRTNEVIIEMHSSIFDAGLYYLVLLIISSDINNTPFVLHIQGGNLKSCNELY